MAASRAKNDIGITFLCWTSPQMGNLLVVAVINRRPGRAINVGPRRHYTVALRSRRFLTRVSKGAAPMRCGASRPTEQWEGGVERAKDVVASWSPFNPTGRWSGRGNSIELPDSMG